MAHYAALVDYTDRGIANVKDSPARLDKARALLRDLGFADAVPPRRVHAGWL